MDRTANEALISAVVRAELPEIKSLLASLADPNAVDEHGETPLFEASATSALDTVALLLQWGADPQRRSRDGMVPRQLTANRSILTLFDIFERKTVPASNKELMLSELEPSVSRGIEDLLNFKLMPEQSSVYQEEGLDGAAAPPSLLSGFYQDEQQTDAQPLEPLEPPPPSLARHPSAVASGRPYDLLGAPSTKGVQVPPPPPLARKPLPELGPEAEREVLAETKQVFEVVYSKRCKAYAKPDLQSTVLTSKSRGALLHGVELTMNFWLRLHDRMEGWMLVDMQGLDGQREVLRARAPLELAVRSYQAQGICCLEVELEAGVCVRAVPSERGCVLSTRGQGERVFAQAQNFSGWLRLTGGEGWVHCFHCDGSEVLQLLDVPPEVDLWAINDIWRAARQACDGPLNAEVIRTLKKLQEDCFFDVCKKLAACPPGSTDGYLAAGLLEKDMRQPRSAIARSLYAHVLRERLNDDGLAPFAAHLELTDAPPVLKEFIALIEYTSDEGTLLCHLGPDSTVFEAESGEVAGLWNMENEEIIPMTHLCEFYQASPHNDDGLTHMAAEGFLENRQGEDALVAEDHHHAGEEEAGTEDWAFGVVDAMDRPEPDAPVPPVSDLPGFIKHCEDLVKALHFMEALMLLDNAMLEYSRRSQADLDIELSILKIRAQCWEGIREHERVLVVTNRILALEAPVRPQGGHFHTGMAADPEVRRLRRAAFAERSQGRTLRQSCNECGAVTNREPSLADLD